MVEKTVFSNGLRVVTIPQRDTKTVTVLVLVGTGSKYEIKERGGISHFLEHMFFKGTKKRPSAVAVTEPIDRVGGIFNAFTGEEHTGYFIKLDGAHANVALDLVSDIFFNSLLSAAEIQKEKGVVIEELHMHRDIPMSRVQVLWNKLLYGDQPAGWDIVGTEESVRGLSRRDLVSYVKSQYVSSNTVVCVAGNVGVDHVVRKVRSLFGGIRTSDFQQRQKVVERQTSPEALCEYRETDQTHIALGARGYNLFHPMRYAQDLLGTILGGMMSSRLFDKVRGKLGLAYYISTSSESNGDTGSLVTTAGIKNESYVKAIRAIVQEYQKLKTTLVSKKELQKAKDHEKGMLAITLEPSDARAFFYGMQELLEKKILTPEEIYDKIDKVRAQDLRRIAQDIFRPEKCNLVVLGPHKNQAELMKLLSS